MLANRAFIGLGLARLADAEQFCGQILDRRLHGSFGLIGSRSCLAQLNKNCLLKQIRNMDAGLSSAEILCIAGH